MTENPNKLYPAMIRARAAIQPITKTAKNPHFGNAYAPLGEVLAAVLPALAAEGLALVAGITDGPALNVRIIEQETGEYASSLVPLVGASDMQKLGGAMTYAMRYGVGMLLALELDDDDDGEQATNAGGASRPVQGAQGGARPTPQSSPAPARSQGKGGAQGIKGKECPSCHNRTIIKGKAEFGGGWLCWKKEGGCGAKYTDQFWETVDPSQAPRSDSRFAAPAGSGATKDDVFPPNDDLDLSSTF